MLYNFFHNKPFWSRFFFKVVYIVLFFLMVLFIYVRCVFFGTGYYGLPHESDLPKLNIFPLDGIGRNFGCRDQKMDSSSALESYGSLLSNAPSLVAIV